MRCTVIVAMMYSWLLFLVCVVADKRPVSSSQSLESEDDDDDMLNISIFYQSHCEECGDFFASKLQPIFCKIKQYVNLEFVPYGNLQRPRGLICEKGMKVCRGNAIQNCVLSRISDPVAQLDYVTCALSDPDLPRYINHVCLDKHNISKLEMEQCATSQVGQQLMLLAEMKTKSVVPGTIILPTIVFNNKYHDYDQWNALLDLEVMICNKLDNYGYGDICNNGVITNKKRCKRTYIPKGFVQSVKFTRVEPLLI